MLRKNTPASARATAAYSKPEGSLRRTMEEAMRMKTGERFCKTERFFGNEMREVLKKSMESPARICGDNEDKGSSLRLDVYHSQSCGKVFCQLYEYIPYKYEACSKIYEHTYEEGTRLIEK